MNLLNEDNVVHVFLNKLGDIVIANLLFILCCIPVITIGPSLTALYHCMMRTVKGNNNGTTKTFFRAFKENFKQSLIIWLLILAAGTMIILNIRFLLHAEGSAAHMLFYLSVGVLTLLIIFTLYIFPVIATFANTLGALCRNAFLPGIYAFPHNDRHCGDHDLSIVYDISRCKAAATLRMLLVFLWIWTCSFYKFDAVVSIF